MENDRIVRIEAKVDRLNDKLSSIDSTLAAQHESLKEHMRRTDLLERGMEPVKKHVAMVQGAFKFVGLVALFTSMLEGIAAFLSYLGK